MNDNDDIILEPLSPPKDVATNSALLMKKLAEDAPLDGIDLDGDKLVNKAKLFIIAQACNELNRVIKLTNFLDTLEEKFIDAVTFKIEESPHNLQLLTYAMETITESLNRSNQLITQILKDEKLSSVIINTTNIITPDGSSATVMPSRTATPGASSTPPSRGCPGPTSRTTPRPTGRSSSANSTASPRRRSRRSRRSSPRSSPATATST